MNIYISHRREGDFENDLYLPLIDSEIGKNNTFIFPHKKRDTPFDVKGALERGDIDLVVAEVSAPATGQGIELGWAYMYKVPIICIYVSGSDVSGSLKVLTDTFFEYKNLSDVFPQINQYISRAQS